jgi:hypothetical protein
MEAADGGSNIGPVAPTDYHTARSLDLCSLARCHPEFPFRLQNYFKKACYVGQIVLDDVEEFIDALESIQGCQFVMSKGGEKAVKTGVREKERQTFTIADKAYAKARWLPKQRHCLLLRG